MKPYSGMPASEIDLTGTTGWRRPWSGPNGGACVEAVKLPDGSVALRQSTDPNGPALIFNPTAIAAFLAGTKDGQADFLLQH